MLDTLRPHVMFFQFPLLTLQSWTGPWVFSLKQFTYPLNRQAANTFLSPEKKCKWICCQSTHCRSQQVATEIQELIPITPVNIFFTFLYNLPDCVPCKVQEFNLLKSIFSVAFIYIKKCLGTSRMFILLFSYGYSFVSQCSRFPAPH